MHKVVIFGNSGSGKSTLAKKKAAEYNCFHLDLDMVAWEEEHEPPIRKPTADSEVLIRPFLADNENWIIEGCYSDLLALVMSHATEIIFLNPGVATCIRNCKNRPWESHKYESLEAQNANLEMLIAWIEKYERRDDEFSLQAHRRLFDRYAGIKSEYRSNERND